MNFAPPSTNPAHGDRLAALLVLTCATLALANLPADDLPLTWLLAFSLPGALLGLIRNRVSRPWSRAMLAVALQAGACYLALKASGPMTRPAALACTILPPLAFVTARRQSSDGALALFLSFCVLMVGVILDGIHVPLIAAYCAAAYLSLCSAAHLAARATSKPHAIALPDRGQLLRACFGITVASLLAAIAIERTLAALPALGHRRSAASLMNGDDPTGPRSVGLSEAFVLDGGRGLLEGLVGERLVSLRGEDRADVPSDLYLRSGFFAVPGLDRWQLGPLERTPAPAGDSFTLRTPQAGAPLLRVAIERSAAAHDLVFTPPGTCEVAGLVGLVVDPDREWLRQLESSPPAAAYQVTFQRFGGLPTSARIDARATSHGLLALPPDLERGRFEQLLEAWGVVQEPRQAMDQVAAGLSQRCRYDLSEPVGPHLHALENFLFSDGERHGYCMHFAAAAALLLRVRGIACRIAVGLYGGDIGPTPEGGRTYGAHHAHAWVEVPIEGRGYVVFDPTPAGQRRRSTPTGHDPTTMHATTAPTTSDSRGERDASMLGWLTRPWLIMLAMVLIAAVALWPTSVPAKPGQETPPAARSARRLLARLLRALADAGHVRAPGQTLEHFACQVAQGVPLPGEVNTAFATYQEVRFGGRCFDAAREAVLLRGIEAANRLHPDRAAP